MVISATPIAKFFAKVIPADDPSEAEAKKSFAKAAAAAGQVGRQGPHHDDREAHSPRRDHAAERGIGRHQGDPRSRCPEHEGSDDAKRDLPTS